MTILVTGADGFIGRHLVAELTRRGDTVIGIDKRPLSLLGVSSVALDMGERGWTSSLPGAPDVVVHLAQSLRYREFPAGSQDMVRVNIDATHELLEWSRQKGVRRFLFASTGNVYAPRGNDAVTEEDACEPGSFYAATKFSAEHLVRSYAAHLQPVILRLFGVYGPGQKNMLIPSLVEKVLSGAEITLAQGVGLLLTPLFIDDCSAILAKMSTPETALRHDTYNLAGVETVSIKQIADEIGAHAGRQPRYVKTTAPPTYLIGSPKRCMSETGIAPKVLFSEGIKRVMAG